MRTCTQVEYLNESSETERGHCTGESDLDEGLPILT